MHGYQLGGGQDRGPQFQQGYGLGGYFRKFFKWILPIAQKHALPHLQNGAEAIGKQVSESISNIARDTINGKNIKESAQNNIDLALNNLKNKAEAKLRGEGIKRKRSSSRSVIFKRKPKTKHRDIFD
jgi:hypothetical protein